MRFAQAKAECHGAAKGLPVMAMTASSPPASEAELAWAAPEQPDDNRMAAFLAMRQQTPDETRQLQAEQWEAYQAQQRQQADASSPFIWDKDTF